MSPYQKFIDAISNLPIALQPVYEGDPNQSIILYKGSLELHQTFLIDQNETKEHMETGCGRIEIAWFPLPYIKFEFSNNNQAFWLSFDKPIILKLPELNISVPIRFSECHQGGRAGNKVSGRITEPIDKGLGQNLSYVKFHVVNFSDFIGSPTQNSETQNGWRNNRVDIELVEENWKLTLDKSESISKHFKELRANGGFAITHIGKMERFNGEVFSHSEFKEVLNIFQNFLSFARGFRVPVILLSGYNVDGNEIWEYWSLSKGDPWKGVKSLCRESNASPQFIADVFPGFLHCWQDKKWKKSVEFILHCYLEADIGAGGAEGAIILSQTALELIAYIQCQQSGNAAQKIRKLLSEFGIPINVPPENTQEPSPSGETLSSFAQTLAILQPQSPACLENLRQCIEQKNSQAQQANQRWEDGPQALTGIRNDIAHAEKRLDFLDETQTTYVRWDASDLGLWYLDVVLLNLFGYQGQYINRLTGKPEDLPRITA